MSSKQQEKIKEDFEKERPDKRPFDTLLKSTFNSGDQRGYSNTWYPIPTEVYRDILKINMDDMTDENREIMERLLRNISYNLQYLEFIEKELNELEPSTVLTKMLQKTYVVTAASIIEGILMNIIISYKWSQKKVKKISFQEAINITKTKCEENGNDTKIFDRITTIKDLRNKIHLTNKKETSSENDNPQKETSILDHDYNAFDENVKIEAGQLLYTILKSPHISNTSEYFEFLNKNFTNNVNKKDDTEE